MADAHVLIGLAAGDMLGAPAEFMSPEKVRERYGLIAGPVARSEGAFEAGEVTDDTQMALALLAAYPADDGLVPRAVDACRDWLACRPRDAGILTRAALEGGAFAPWRSSGFQSCGNGALMRAAASVAAGRDGLELLEDAVRLGAITHADPRSILCCATLCAALRSLLDGAAYAEAWAAALPAAGGLDLAGLVEPQLGAEAAAAIAARRDPALAEVTAAVRAGLAGTGAGNGGYAVSTLQTAIARGAAASFADGVLPVVREGGDADTVAAVTGAILGARALLPPEAWLADIRCGERFPAWPRTGPRGPEAVRRLEEACRRAAGAPAPMVEAYPYHVPPFAAHRVHAQVLYGRNPLFRKEIEALAGAGVTHVLDLREPAEWGRDRLGGEAVDACAAPAAGLRRLNVPVGDGGAPPPEALGRAVDFIEEATQAGGIAYVHCRAGRERTGSVLLAWWLARGRERHDFDRAAPHLRPLRHQEAAALAWLKSR